MDKDDPLQTLVGRIRTLGEQALGAIAAAADPVALESLRVRYLGKKSEFTGLMSQLGKLPAEQRPEVGKVSNEVKSELTEAVRRRREAFDAAERQRKLGGERIDVTLPGRPAPLGRLHPLTQGRREILEIFRELGFEVASGPDLEDEFHNFEALNIPANHPARDMQDTFYLTGGGVLRTHTSPVQIRAMRNRKPPLAVVAPGRVYRCDADTTHSPMFNQIEGFLVDERVRMSDLKGVLRQLIRRYFGEDRPMRLRPSFFPFTEPSAEVDVLWRNAAGREEWLEVLGAGMIHPVVLKNVGYDPAKVTGFAFGLGVERFVMLKHGITNIRLFYENDLRFLSQF
jgi:phenylalanyl-tRNA synthetase alpha chain